MTIKNATKNATVAAVRDRGLGVGVHTHPQLPPCNEMMAVLIGSGLTSPEVPVSSKNSLKDFLGRYEGVDIVYKQNTADEVNIALPCFPEFDKYHEESALSDEELAMVSGGEVVALLTLFFMTVGAIVAAKIGLGMVVKSVAIGIGIGVSVAVAAGAALGIAGVTAAVGVGIAAGAGAFDPGAGPVNVVLGS